MYSCTCSYIMLNLVQDLDQLTDIDDVTSGIEAASVALSMSACAVTSPEESSA